jgi:hypothetical protein
MFCVRSALVVGTIAVGLTATSACAPKKAQPTRTPISQSNAAPMTDQARRIAELTSRARALQQAADALPARNAADDARLTVEAFDRADAALEALAGAEQAGFFRQQLRVMKESRDQIQRSGADGRAAPEAVVDTALRAMRNAISSIQEQQFPANAEVADRLSQLRSHLQELDAVRGPLHRLVVAQAFESMAGAVQRMADVYEKRGSTTAPAQR